MQKKRLAIISTFDDLCGIAGYTRRLVHNLKDDFDIEVFDLNQFFMRGKERKVSAAADRMVQEFCARAKTFDFVNIQLEHGTLASTRRDFARRFAWLAEAAPALSVTFHTVLPDRKLDIEALIEATVRLNFYRANKILETYRDTKTMNTAVYGALKREAGRKQVNVIVHTKRDMMTMQHAIGLENVVDHPLAFFSREDATYVRDTVSRRDFPALARLPRDSVLIGVFGFLSEYKGFETVIHALKILPDTHHLLFFGGVHPNEIKQNQKVYPYVARLIEAANASVQQMSAGSGPNALADRIHFMGAQTDDDFARAMCVCDNVVLPYLEVGQSASGPMSIALEMGARVIAARNRTFLEFSKYHPGLVEMFEIGNHLELAHKILTSPPAATFGRHLAFNTHTNRAVYCAANSIP